jgi:type III restriction enzyme
MKILLKSFQETRAAELYSEARLAKFEVEQGGKGQALVLASPTGSGKTVMVTALMELIVEGDDDHPGDESAVFLWLSDAPDLNEQSLRKIRDASSVFGPDDLVTIDAQSFKQRRLAPGKIYFLNTQKLGKSSLLVKGGDEQAYTVWEALENTLKESPGSFWLIVDEAHKGMLEEKDAKAAATIVQKLVKGSSEIDAVPLMLGISATPERFITVLEGKGTSRTKREVVVTPGEVRISGLLKDTITLYHPERAQPSDYSFLKTAAEKLKRYRDEWQAYCEQESEPFFEPLLVVQVEDQDTHHEHTRTDLEQALLTLEEVLGPLEDHQIAHSFQEHYSIEVGDRSLHYISPADIQDETDLRVVFFKLSLNTGWDCPRAEVIMSFRKALDYTRIAQLVGRLVRTPLARRVTARDFLNSVALYLPHYDRKTLERVRNYLSSPETGLAAPPEIVEGNELAEYERDQSMAELFKHAETLPTYAVERLSKASNVRRLIRLGRALAFDKLEPDALEDARRLIVAALESERKQRARTAAFKTAIDAGSQIGVRGVTYAYGDDVSEADALDESFDAVAAVSRNIDDIYEQSGRKLGEGLHKAWVKARVAAGVKPIQAKLELAEFLNDEKVVKKLETVAGKRFRERSEAHKAAINTLPEARRDVYRKLRRLGINPEPEPLELPLSVDAVKGPGTFKSHLYADKNGRYSCVLNDWEETTLAEELKNDQVVGWLRNVPRKPWAFRIPYKYDGEEVPMFPDFLVFRRQGAGLVVDILEPHRLTQDDSAAKAVGLADFAVSHGDQFGRIELIIKKKNKLVRLDVNRDEIRDKVRAVSSNEHLRQLFETAG